MGHSAAVWDSRMALERTKDWNGIEQIVLRNPQGASAKVSSYSLRFFQEFMFSFKKILSPTLYLCGIYRVVRLGF